MNAYQLFLQNCAINTNDLEYNSHTHMPWMLQAIKGYGAHHLVNSHMAHAHLLDGTSY